MRKTKITKFEYGEPIPWAIGGAFECAEKKNGCRMDRRGNVTLCESCRRKIELCLDNESEAWAKTLKEMQ